MKVLFSGATGVIGRGAVPLLAAAGHHVTGVSRDRRGSAWLDSVGASSIDVDLFDQASVSRAVEGNDAVCHFATSIPPFTRMKKASAWAMNDRLRDEATANLVEACIARGVGRFIQESVTFFYADGADDWLDEASPVRPASPILLTALSAEEHVQQFTEAGGTGISLRLARLYGPGKASAETVAAVRARKAPVVGSGDNYVSSLHTSDAGTAVVAAMAVPAGAYNLADDEPVTARRYVESLAEELGAAKPRRVPRWLARTATGVMLPLLTISHRVSNRAFKDVTGWAPNHRSVVEGWGDVVAASSMNPAESEDDRKDM